MEKIAVYGTLKRWWFWHHLVQKANAEFICDDYIEIEGIRSVKWDSWDRSYPHVVLGKNTQKFLRVEIFSISLAAIKQYIDPVEEYTWSSNDPYIRKKNVTLWWIEVWWYNSNWSVWNDTENFFTHQDWEKRFYDWEDK